MQDLNDYFYFAQVVAHGGFAPAGRALRQPKSKLSRRIAGLEARLGARLIERSTRRFRVTEVGQSFYERCRTILAEAEQAEALVAQARAEPHGIVRFSCPTGLIETLSPTLPAFLQRYPAVRLQMLAVDRPVDLIQERIDVALRVRVTLNSDAALTMRSLGTSLRILVASPGLVAMAEPDIAGLARLPTLSTDEEADEAVWTLETSGGDKHVLRHQPRMNCNDFTAIRDAAAAGIGVALLPDHVCRADIAAGRLVRLYPGWRGQAGIVHVVFTTRRGLPPAVRAFIDHLAANFPSEVVA
jgi:DNA-binding transcriptional LysR family regulator